MLYRDWNVVIEGDGFSITPMLLSDEKEYAKLLLGKRMVENLSSISDCTGIREIIDHTEDAETHVIRDSAGHFIGWIVLQKDEEGIPDVGIKLIPEYRNQGIGSQAVKLFVNRLHDVYDLSEIQVRISDDNVQSQKAFAKVGAMLEKTEPNPSFIKLMKELPEDILDIPQLNYYKIPLPVEEEA